MYVDDAAGGRGRGGREGEEAGRERRGEHWREGWKGGPQPGALSLGYIPAEVPLVLLSQRVVARGGTSGQGAGA